MYSYVCFTSIWLGHAPIGVFTCPFITFHALIPTVSHLQHTCITIHMFYDCLPCIITLAVSWLYPSCLVTALYHILVFECSALHQFDWKLAIIITAVYPRSYVLFCLLFCIFKSDCGVHLHSSWFYCTSCTAIVYGVSALYSIQSGCSIPRCSCHLFLAVNPATGQSVLRYSIFTLFIIIYNCVKSKYQQAWINSWNFHISNNVYYNLLLRIIYIIIYFSLIW